LEFIKKRFSVQVKSTSSLVPFQFSTLKFWKKVTAENGGFWQTKKGCRFVVVVYFGDISGRIDIEEHLDIAAGKKTSPGRARVFDISNFSFSVQKS